MNERWNVTWDPKFGACFFLGHQKMGVEPKIGGFYPPNHPFVHRVFHYKPPSILGVNTVNTPIFGSTPKD